MRHFYAQNFKAAAAVAGKRLVALDANGAAITAAAADAKIIGVSDPVGAGAGDQLDVHILGEQWLVAGGVVAPGDPVTADAEGRAVVAADGRSAGFATTASTAIGDEILVLLLPHVVAP